jgi:hypothetical protein
VARGLHWRRAIASRLESLAQECRARGGDALAVPTDVTNTQDLEWLVSETLKAYGGIDVVIHNAGITMWSRFDALKDLEIFERVMEVNYYAPVRLTALTLPHLRASRGLIVAIASLAGLTGVPERSAYSGSKTRHDRLLRFAAHRARGLGRGRERDRARLRGQRDPQARHRPGWRTARHLAHEAVEDHDRRGMRAADRARHREAPAPAADVTAREVRHVAEAAGTRLIDRMAAKAIRQRH